MCVNLLFSGTSVLVKHFMSDIFMVATVAGSIVSIMANVSLSSNGRKYLVITSSQGLVLILKRLQCIFSLV